MKVLIIIGIFFVQALFAFIIIRTFFQHIKALKLYVELSEKYLKINKKRDLPFYYSSEAIKIKAFQRIRPKKTQRDVVLQCAAIKNLQLTIPLIHRNATKNKPDPAIVLLYGEIAYLTYDYKLCHDIVSKLENIEFSNNYLKMRYLRLQALDDLYQTDMFSASQHISQVLEFYQKKGLRYEEADCYQIMAQIYRISGIFDVAFSMLKEAQKIYKELKLPIKIAEMEAYFGLNEIGRENYQTAKEYFLKAEKICQPKKFNETRQNIRNWLGLIDYQTKNYAGAENYLTAALNNTKKSSTKAFATELLARLYYQQNDEQKALQYIKISLDYCTNDCLKSGYFENQYLRAEIYYNQKQYKISRKILTELIKYKSYHKALYYPANAYTLLGTIEYEEGNIERAKTLFKQALDLEHSRNRLKGAAIDYNNLAEISRRMGEKKEAEMYLNQAIKYAQEIEDKELEDYLKQKL